MFLSTSASRSDRNDNVFINCPFDEDFRLLFEAITFTVLACELNPRCGLEASNGGQQRLDKIQQLVTECDFGIHDLSYVKIDKKIKLPRFNMPFEYGLQLREAWSRNKSTKRPKISLLVLEGERHSLDKCLSDAKGIDPEAYGNDRKILVTKVRNWLASEIPNRPDLPAPKLVIDALDEFKALLPYIAKRTKIGHEEALTFTDLVKLMQRYLLERKPEGLATKLKQ